MVAGEGPDKGVHAIFRNGAALSYSHTIHSTNFGFLAPDRPRWPQNTRALVSWQHSHGS
jgi:hypothetical protein